MCLDGEEVHNTGLGPAKGKEEEVEEALETMRNRGKVRCCLLDFVGLPPLADARLHHNHPHNTGEPREQEGEGGAGGAGCGTVNARNDHCGGTKGGVRRDDGSAAAGG